MLLNQVVVAMLVSLVARPIKVAILEADKKTPKVDPVTLMPLYKDTTVPLKEDEFLEAVLRDDTLIVITTDGKKISKVLTDKELEKLTKAITPEDTSSSDDSDK